MTFYNSHPLTAINLCILMVKGKVEISVYKLHSHSLYFRDLAPKDYLFSYINIGTAIRLQRQFISETYGNVNDHCHFFWKENKTLK